MDIDYQREIERETFRFKVAESVRKSGGVPTADPFLSRYPKPKFDPVKVFGRPPPFEKLFTMTARGPIRGPAVNIVAPSATRVPIAAARVGRIVGGGVASLGVSLAIEAVVYTVKRTFTKTPLEYTTEAFRARQLMRNRAATQRSSIIRREVDQLRRDLERDLKNAEEGIRPSVSVDMSDFRQKFRKYLQYTKKSLSEAVNEKAYFIALNAYRLTPAVARSDITSELLQPSRAIPRLTLAQMLAMTRKSKRNKKASLEQQGRLIMRARQRSVAFLKAGWIPALRTLAVAIQKRFGKTYKGRPKGGAAPARTASIRPIASLWNDVRGGKTPSAKVHAILVNALQAAVNKEAASMAFYVERKLQQAAQKAGMS